MKGFFLVLVLLGGVLLGYLIFNFAQARRRQVDVLPDFEAGTDSIQAYLGRIEELERRAKGVRSRIATAPINERVIRQRELAVLEDKIRELRLAVEQWRQARTKTTANDLYRKCIMLYGSASGVCELLLSDTLPAAGTVK
ncbi:MAG: hypothetical protein N2248_04455 [candidate division WOR-3 bacterium]|uniref:Uncharacterized protein n=1 Tax=candidate division WOR-3 bacterium TaxID=2052148 RepID=A0A7C1NPD9_UNCW3|nr:hypothetical protein [candidate division WOR-3 bacterium]